MPFELATFLLPSGIKAVRANGSGVITQQDADLLMHQINPGGPFFGLPRLFDTVRMERMTAEARSIFSGPSQPGMDPVWVAGVVTSPVIRVTTNFLLRVSGSPLAASMKMFSDEKEAIAWLDERAREDAAKKPGSTP